MGTVVGVLIGLLLVSPANADLSDREPLPTVQLEVELPDREIDVASASDVVLRTGHDEVMTLRVRVFQDGDPLAPVRVDDTAQLLEIRSVSEGAHAVRFGDMEEYGPGVYQTTYRTDAVGDFVIELLPDLEDRTRLTSESTDRVTLRVGGPPEAGSTVEGGPEDDETAVTPLIIGSVALVLVVGVLVYRATGGRPPTHKEPVAHDTWWNSP